VVVVEEVAVLRGGGRLWCRRRRGGVLRISLLQWTGQYEALANKAVSKRSGQPRNAKRDSRSVLTDR
jgi:hypothetical protein